MGGNMRPTHILLGISSDTVVCLATGTFEELSDKKGVYLDVCEHTGIKLKVENISEKLIDTESGEVITETNKVTEEYRYLIGI